MEIAYGHSALAHYIELVAIMNLSAPLSSALISTSASMTQEPATVPKAERIDNGRNLEWPKSKPFLESRLMLVLDSSGKTPEKDRHEAFKDIQTWNSAGPENGRATDDGFLVFINKFYESDLMTKANALGQMQALTIGAAGAAGKNTGTAGLDFVRNLSDNDRGLFFAANATPDKYGRYEFKSEDEYNVVFSRLEQEWKPSPSSTAGGQVTRDEALAISRLEAVQAQQKQQLGRLTDEYNNRFGSTRTVTDTIELSGPGAKAAAKTLQTDGANDVALKALEALKQVGEQQREWAKSLAEEDATKPSATASNDSKTPVAPNIAKPGSVLSIAA